MHPATLKRLQVGGLKLTQAAAMCRRVGHKPGSGRHSNVCLRCGKPATRPG